MDPDTTLRELRELTEIVVTEVVGQGASPSVGDFVDRFQALDEWLAKGGFIPAAWKQQQCHECIRLRRELEDERAALLRDVDRAQCEADVYRRALHRLEDVVPDDGDAARLIATALANGASV